jgi:Zn-finger nucleic acid-binding protein
MQCPVCNAYSARLVISANKTDKLEKYYCPKCLSVWQKNSETDEIVKIWKSLGSGKGVRLK